VTLRRSHNSDAEDSEEAAGLEVLLANHSDEMALHTLSRAAEAGPQSYFVPFDTKAAAVAALEKYVAAGNPAARRIRAVAMRRGTLYPQDDVGATKELIAAAEGGDVTAMDLLADAYGDGTGVTENNDEEFRWKKAAAKAGSVEAARDLIFFMPFRSAYKGFSVHDSLVTGLVLYADKLSFYDLPMGYDSVFASRDIEDLGLDYIARGIMDGFRASMAARNDEFAVRLFKKIPKDVKLAVESILSQDGYLKTTPDGFMGPDARAALIAWAREKGLPDMEADQRAESAVAEADARLTGVPTVPDDLMNLLRDKAFTGAKAAKTKKDREMAIKLMALLAQYGDLQPRIAILTNYSGSKTVRDVVVPGLAVLYGLDILLTQPSDYDKAEIDFIFTVTELAKAGQIATAADVVLLALRDDPRMRDPDNLERIAGQFIFAPELCEALATQAERAKVEGVEKDGCSGASRRALIAWAKAKGPAGDEAAARKRAADVMLTVPH
jgi:hypothetical protein